MFTSARLKLTGWYSLIILSISLLFSLAIYALVNRDLRRIEVNQRAWLESQRPILHFQPEVIETYLEGTHSLALARKRFVINLVGSNAIIVGLAALAGFFLAGRTLRPIQEALDEQSRFVADASHELRTPITSLRTQLEVTLRSKVLTPAEGKSILLSLLEDVIDLQRLSDNLIALARHKEQGVDSMSSLDLTAIVSTAVKKISPQAKAKQVIIKSSLIPVKLVADGPALSEAIVILLDNAVKYSPPNSQVNLTSQKKGGVISIIVSDSGPGIAKKDLPHLFDRFFRSDSSRTSAGFGLGLSIAQKIVRRHGGDIKVKSSATGSTFAL